MERRFLACLVALIALVCATSTALAHVERTSYWPDPPPDTSGKPAARGQVPKARSLASAVVKAEYGTPRVVCQPDSLTQLRAEIERARRDGIDLRPTQTLGFGTKQAASLLAVNQKLFAMCKYHEIQPAVTA